MQQINTPQPDLRQRSSEDNNVEKDLNIYLESTNIIKMIREINEPFTQHTQLMTRLEFKQPDIITQVLQKLPQSLQYFKDTYSAAEYFIERAKQIEKIITFKNWKLLPDLPFLLTFIIKSNLCISDEIIHSAFYHSLGFKLEEAKALTPQYFQVIQTLSLILPVSEWQHTPLDKLKSHFKDAAHYTLSAKSEGYFVRMCKT